MRRLGTYVAVVLIAGSMLSATAIIARATFTTKEVILTDGRRGTSLIAQVGPAASDAGHFIFVVGGRGSYEVTD